MPIPFFHSIAAWVLKKRIGQVEWFMKYPHETQQELLYELLRIATTTEIGQAKDFKSVRHYEDFKNRLPIVSYEEIAGEIDRARRGEKNIFWSTPIKYFAKSSGTTDNKSKFIPVSKEAIEDCHFKAGKDMLSLYFNNNENSQLLAGKCLRLGGSQELYYDYKSYFGDLSAIIIDNLPFWAEISSTPSHKVSMLSEWEHKIKAIVDEAVQEKVTGLAGVPSWMLVLLQNVLETSGKRDLKEVWPDLEVYFHGGVSFKPYQLEYEQLIPKAGFQYYEIYNASEGFFAIQDRNEADDLLLMLDYGIFYEFIPMKNYDTEKVIPLWEVALEEEYAMVITTNAGLWRYQIGDTVRFTSLSPYRIQVTGRTKHHINVFGEELIIDNAEKALAKATEATKSILVDYTAGPVFMDKSSKGGHEWIIEFKKQPQDLEQFTRVLDATLQELNSDYESKRYKNMTLKLPKVHAARTGLFYEWLQQQNKLGGQHKVPRLSNKRDFLETLLKMNGN